VLGDNDGSGEPIKGEFTLVVRGIERLEEGRRDREERQVLNVWVTRAKGEE
jgi:hypothetical protein